MTGPAHGRSDGFIGLRYELVVGELGACRCRQCRPPCDCHLRHGLREHGYWQGVFKLPRESVDVIVGADNNDSAGSPAVAVEHSGQPGAQSVEAAADLLDDRLCLAVVAVDHHDDRRLMLEDADGGLLVADDGRDGYRQSFDGLEQPNRHDVVKPCIGQCFQQQRGLGGGLVVPGHSDDPQMVIACGGQRVHPHDFFGDLLRGIYGGNAATGEQRQLVMVQDGAVCAMSFSKDPPDGGWRH